MPFERTGWTVWQVGPAPSPSSGCALCQEACPFNRFAPFGHLNLAPHPHLIAPDLAAPAAATEASFKSQFRVPPITCAGKRGMLRNLALTASSARSGGESI